MAVKLTGQNIKDTYQQLIHSPEGSLVYDGTGSLLPLKFEGNNVKISGSLIANEYVVSSSVTNISIATLSGSTTFGDSVDDTHVFTGNITASGDISASGNIYADRYYVEGKLAIDYISGLTQIVYGQNNQSAKLRGATVVLGDDATQHVTASGNISASGDLIASSSLTLGAPLSKIIGPGNNDYIALGVDNIDIFINNGEVINIDNDSINLNSSAQAINTTITSDDGTHLVMADATSNAVRLNNSIIMSPGAPTDYTNRLLISGSTHFTGSNSHITASGNISASGDIYGGNIITTGNFDANDSAKYRVDGYSVIQNSSDTLKIAGNNYWTKITYGNEITDQHSFTGDITGSANISASGTIEAQNFLLGSVGSIKVKDTSGNTDDTAVINLADVGITFGDTDILTSVQGDTVVLDAAGDVKIDSATGLIRFQDSTVDSIVFNAQNGVGQITASGNVSSSGEIIAASGSFEIIHGGTF